MSRSRPPWSRTYLARQGHVTKAQKRALRELWPAYGLTFRYGELLDLDRAFGRPGPTTLEVGFGMGANLLSMASANPQRLYLGIEPHRPALGATLQGIASRRLENVRLVRGDALLVLADYLDGALFDQVCVFFPDPWPRPKDVHRRLINPAFLALLEQRLVSRATLHVATDVEVYAEHARGVLSNRPRWTNVEPEGGFVPRPRWRPLEGYEARAVSEGRKVWDLEFGFKL